MKKQMVILHAVENTTFSNTQEDKKVIPATRIHIKTVVGYGYKFEV